MREEGGAAKALAILTERINVLTEHMRNNPIGGKFPVFVPRMGLTNRFFS